MTTKPDGSGAVAAFIAGHPRRQELERIRQIVLAAHPGLTEHVKWNAPSFCKDDDDRITLNLHGDKLSLVFHRGAKVKDATGFEFADPSGLIAWKAKDRGVVTFASQDEIEDLAKPLARLVKA